MKMLDYNSMPAYLRDFLIYSSSILNKSQLTVNEQYLDIRTFYRYLLLSRGLVDSSIDFEKIDITEFNEEILKSVSLNDIYMFLIFCKDVRNNSAKTRARKCSTIRTYFKFLTNNKNVLSTNPAALLDTPKTQQEIPKFLSLEESVDLLSSIDGKNYERDYCIITLFLNCGIRLSELCAINLSDIKDDTLKVTGKGNKQRIVYLNSACKNAIDAYLKVRPVDGIPATDKNALFISQQRRRISNKTVQHIVYKFIDKSGLGGKGYSVHKLRHTAATLMYQHGNVDIRVLKDILGHVNLNTTQIYTHISNQQIEKAINLNPLAKIKTENKKKEQ